jgi:hypothetical protein
VSWKGRGFVGVLLLALAAAAGFILADRTREQKTTAVTVVRTETGTVAVADPGLPTAVESKRAEILRIAEAKDYDGLVRLTLWRGVFVWPFAYDKTADEITEYDETLLKKTPPDGAAVGSDFVAGD